MVGRDHIQLGHMGCVKGLDTCSQRVLGMGSDVIWDFRDERFYFLSR